MSIQEEILKLAREVKEASRYLSKCSSKLKDEVLLAMSKKIKEKKDLLLEANQKDIASAEEENLPPALIDRLLLNDKRIDSMADGLKDVAQLKDPVGEVVGMWRRPNGLQIGQIRVPLGVVGIIYESRPNVTADATGLCLKSGNAIILRGGREAINSNKAIASLLQEALKRHDLPEPLITLIESTDRAWVQELVKLNGYIDVVILRGGKALLNVIGQESKVPIIAHGEGNCHTYIDKGADIDMAVKIAFNAKVQRPGVCNAMETLLVHKERAEEFLPIIAKKLKEAQVEIRGCPRTREIITDIDEAIEEDWYKEYLDLILAVKVVGSLDEAIDHINRYGSSHSEAIVTSSYQNSRRFLEEVDAAAIYVNASTRFTDGGEFGLGAEIGISTQKLHARGPMGLRELTTTKFIILGDGQIRE
ncbi:TPA: glutamate-5-semialdehyde dehydrogenase [bacterium]|nr:glutamate-5-semialdehyde dehydrogenase [bacterium]